MKKVGFIGAYDKTDLMIYIAKLLVAIGKKVLIIDSTVNQKAKYVVPVINPTKTYITEFEEIDVAVGFENFKDINRYLGVGDNEQLDYDIVLIDVDTPEAIDEFNIKNSELLYFVTSFDTYSLKRGLEIISGLLTPLHMKKVLFTKQIMQEEDDYLNFLSLGYKVVWDDEKIYFPFELGDQSVLFENQRVSKIKYKKLSEQFKYGIMTMAEQIADDAKMGKIKKVFRQLEKGV